MSWLDQVLSAEPDAERQFVDRYTQSLIGLARRELPDKLRPRVDPEDVVQSVYRSFFRRLSQGEFEFEDSHDVWRLLAVMTYHKVHNVVKHHRRKLRDVYRDVSISDVEPVQDGRTTSNREPQPEDLTVMMECLDRLLSELPSDYHRIVAMRLEGCSIIEIASDVKLSRRTVQRVLSKLRDLAGQQLEDEA